MKNHIAQGKLQPGGAGEPDFEEGVSSRKVYTMNEGLLREYADANPKIKNFIASDIGLEVGSNKKLVEKLKAYKEGHTSTEGGLIAEVIYALNKKVLPKVIISFLEKLYSTQAKIILSELKVDDETATIATALTFDGAATANLSVSGKYVGDSPLDIANIEDAVEDEKSEDESDSSDESGSAAAAAAPLLAKKEKAISKKSSRKIWI